MPTRNLTADEIAQIRRWVGTQPSDADLQVVHHRHQDPDSTALEILETRYAEMLNDPVQHSLAGEVSENWSKNIDSVRKLIDRLEAKINAKECKVDDEIPVAVVTGHLFRADRRRR